GMGSKVWELIHSGITPATSAWSPATFSTMLVIGATVVTILSFFSVATGFLSSCRPQEENPSTNARSAVNFQVHGRVIGSFLCSRRGQNRSTLGGDSLVWLEPAFNWVIRWQMRLKPNSCAGLTNSRSTLHDETASKNAAWR